MKKQTNGAQPTNPADDAGAINAAIQEFEAIAAQGATTSVQRRTRAYGVLLAAANGPDDHLFDAVNDRRQETYRLLCGDPAVTIQDLSRKLAVLVTELLQTNSAEPPLQDLALAASVLADAVLLTVTEQPAAAGLES